MAPPFHSDKPLDPRFADLKREIAESYPNFQERVTKAWIEVLDALEQRTSEILSAGPKVDFKDLQSLTPDQLASIKCKGCLVIRDVVDDAQATEWKTALDDSVKNNPTVDGFPEANKQFFNLYWTKPQVVARTHPNVLAASAWLNGLYHVKSGKALDGVDLSVPLSYSDRFRMRQPGGFWDAHPPHIDGGGIERWEDPAFRAVYGDILAGTTWKEHDAYDIEARLNVNSSLYGRPDQATCFRTFQGWLATEISPGNGTLRLFPDIVLSNAYLILRPFFRPVSPALSESLDAKDWKFDTSTSEFPGMFPADIGYIGPHPEPKLHPHMRLDSVMTSVPTVRPGDMVFWHCDMVHAVEPEHTGSQDSAVMYIGAVPKIPSNTAYVEKQRPCFVAAGPPPDYAKGKSEATFVGIGKDADIVGSAGKVAMGFA